MTKYGYRGYGLSLVSDLELPEFLLGPASDDPDIRISLGAIAIDDWRESADATEGFFAPARSGGYLLRVPGVAVYHVSDGRNIRISVEPGADPGLVRLFTIGSAMGMALHQRGVMVLHGATVVRDGQARIIVGNSGMGKSTLAARLGRAGCAVLGDDTMALWNAPRDRSGRGRSGKWLWPGSRVFKLWQDSIEAMGLEVEGLIRLGNRADKYYMPNPGPQSDLMSDVMTDVNNGFELAEILVLEIGDGPPRVEPLSGIRALQAVALNTYRPEYVALLERETEHFQQCGELAQNVPVSRLIRPWGLESIDETLNLLWNRWETGQVAERSG
jgi:hypothetical protein